MCRPRCRSSAMAVSNIAKERPSKVNSTLIPMWDTSSRWQALKPKDAHYHAASSWSYFLLSTVVPSATSDGAPSLAPEAAESSINAATGR